MRAIPFLLLLSTTTAALAQTPGAPSARTGDALDNAKTAQYIYRYTDEVRARQVIESARAALHTQRYKDALAAFDGTQPKLAVAWDRFVTANGASFVALHLALPPGTSAKAGTKAIVFGEVRDDAGKVLATFEEPSDVVESKGDLFVERALFVDAPHLSGSFGVALNKEVVGLGKAATAPPPAAPARKSLSELIVSTDVYNLTNAQSPFEPFAFGGTKVVPKADLTFRKGDEVWLFAEYVDPDLKLAGAPSLSMRTVVEGNGKKVASPWQNVESAPLKGVPGHFGIGTTVDLASFAPGDYTLHLELRDSATKETFERAKGIVVR